MIEMSLGLGVFISAMATLSSTFLFFNYKNYAKRKKLRIVIFTEFQNFKRSLRSQNEMFERLEDDVEADFQEILNRLHDTNYQNDVFYRKENFFHLTEDFRTDIDVLTDEEIYNIANVFSILNRRNKGIQQSQISLKQENLTIDILELAIESVISQMENEEEKIISWTTVDSVLGVDGEMDSESLRRNFDSKIQDLDNMK